jgi:hypothetical protein
MSYDAISLVRILHACYYKSYRLIILLSSTFSKMIEFIMQQNIFHESCKMHLWYTKLSYNAGKVMAGIM